MINLFVKTEEQPKAWLEKLNEKETKFKNTRLKLMNCPSSPKKIFKT